MADNSESRGRRAVLKAVRGAALAAHAAAGLAATCSLKDAEKLTRTAEGILRAAAASLEVGPVAPPPRPEAPAGVQQVEVKIAKLARKKAAKKRRRLKQKEDKGGAMAVDEGTSIRDLTAGGSVVVGDLTELGMEGVTRLDLPAAAASGPSSSSVDALAASAVALAPAGSGAGAGAATSDSGEGKVSPLPMATVAEYKMLDIHMLRHAAALAKLPTTGSRMELIKRIVAAANHGSRAGAT